MNRVCEECGLAYLSLAWIEKCGELLDVKEYLAGWLIDQDAASLEFLEEIAQIHRGELPQGRLTDLRRHRDVLRELVELLQVFLCREDLTPDSYAAIRNIWRYTAAAKLVGIDPDHYQQRRTPVLKAAS